MTFLLKIKLFIRRIKDNMWIRFLGVDDIKKETLLLVKDNYRIMKKYTSRRDLFGDDDINILFKRELFEVIEYVSSREAHGINKDDICLIRAKYLFNLYNDILIIRGNILDTNTNIELVYIKDKIIQYGGTIDENI